MIPDFGFCQRFNMLDQFFLPGLDDFSVKSPAETADRTGPPNRRQS
jgi:hypothetical protein